MFAELKLIVVGIVLAVVLGAGLYINHLQGTIADNETVILDLKSKIAAQNVAIEAAAIKTEQHKKVVIEFQEKAKVASNVFKAQAKAIQNAEKDAALTDCQNALNLGNNNVF
jgi:hypothetical protein